MSEPGSQGQARLPFTASGEGEGADGRHVDTVVIYCDGGARGNPGPAAIGAVVLDGSVEPPRRLATVSERIEDTTNNVAEYRALIAGLERAAAYGARAVKVRADSELIVRQLEGRYRVRQEHLRPLHARASRLLAAYENVDLAHVRREQNAEADALVNAALDAPPSTGGAAR